MIEKSFSLTLLYNLRKESESCTDVKRLAVILSVSAGLIVSVKVSQEAVAFVCEFLVHEFPRIRSVAAEKLYVRLLETDPDMGEDHAAIRFLLERKWESDWTLEKSDRSTYIQEMINAFKFDDETLFLQ